MSSVTSSGCMTSQSSTACRLSSDDVRAAGAMSSSEFSDDCVDCVACSDVIRSAPDCSIVMPTSCKHNMAVNTRMASHNHSRFKRLFDPIRRSHSTGCHGDSPSDQPPSCSSQLSHAQPMSESDSSTYKTYKTTTTTTTTTTTSSSSSSSSSSSVRGAEHKKSLRCEVRQKLSVLRRRCMELAMPGRADSAPAKPTLESLKAWAQSLDALLADKFGRQCFREFLKSEFSEENVEFWIACDDFKQLNTDNLTAPAHKIFTEFIAHQAPREINIDSVTRDVTYSNMAAGADRHMFEAAQRRIQALMDKDSYPRFLQSDLYLYLLHQATANT